MLDFLFFIPPTTPPMTTPSLGADRTRYYGHAWNYLA